MVSARCTRERAREARTMLSEPGGWACGTPRADEAARRRQHLLPPPWGERTQPREPVLHQCAPKATGATPCETNRRARDSVDARRSSWPLRAHRAARVRSSSADGVSGSKAGSARRDQAYMESVWRGRVWVSARGDSSRSPKTLSDTAALSCETVRTNTMKTPIDLSGANAGYSEAAMPNSLPRTHTNPLDSSFHST